MADLKLEDDNYCFVCGKHNSSGLMLNFNYSDKKAFAEFSITKVHQGYKDIVHGGILATIIDEALIKAALANGLNAMTAEVTVNIPGFFTPRKDIHKCSASIITIQPCGLSFDITISAICVASLSCTCGRLDKISTTRANLLKPVTRPCLGI